MKYQNVVITAAGGNGTVISVIDDPLTRDEYVVRGKLLGEQYTRFGAEQAGFLIPGVSHFEMSGGEFCGNAARSAALLLSELQGLEHVTFTMSGFDGVVEANVEKIAQQTYRVESSFPGLPTICTRVSLVNGLGVSIVDLGGIVHVLINDTFPGNTSEYRRMHKEVVRELNLAKRAAVGVVWFGYVGERVVIHPVVWVRDVDTFFYEQSCGSGSIAASVVTNLSDIIQPTGAEIYVRVDPTEVVLRSEMEVVHVQN